MPTLDIKCCLRVAVRFELRQQLLPLDPSRVALVTEPLIAISQAHWLRVYETLENLDRETRPQARVRVMPGIEADLHDIELPPIAVRSFPRRTSPLPDTLAHL